LNQPSLAVNYQTMVIHTHHGHLRISEINCAGERLVASYGVVGKNPDTGRTAGIVMHPTSLPGAYGTGDLSTACFAFIDWLADAGMKAWQVLPLVPPDTEYFSPYSGQDALCGNPMLISLEELVKEGLLEAGASVPVAIVPSWTHHITCTSWLARQDNEQARRWMQQCHQFM
jgi:4-alpha-glucanotransferase